MPTNKYVGVRNGAYYVVGTRIGLDVLVNDLRNGSTAETILYPTTGSLAKEYGALTFILEHPEDIDGTFMSNMGRTKDSRPSTPCPQTCLSDPNVAVTTCSRASLEPVFSGGRRP